jgi:hypothetical protein
MRMFFPAYVSAKILVNDANPARKTAEVGNMSLGSNVQAEEMLMIVPPFCDCIAGTTRRVARMTFNR